MELQSPERDVVLKACEDILKSLYKKCPLSHQIKFLGESEDASSYGAELCRALTRALEGHPAISAKICEAIAFLARNGTAENNYDASLILAPS